jgi:hypothetical protein
MKYKHIFLTVLFVCGLVVAAIAAEGHSKHDQTNDKNDSPGGFMHEAVTENIRTEFQIMRLADMNLKSEDGTTHHIMVKLFKEGMDHQINDAIGKIKVIGPDKEEQISGLTNYNGVLAANFTFEKQGKYGVMCLLKIDGKKKVIKFWYPHGV